MIVHGGMALLVMDFQQGVVGRLGSTEVVAAAKRAISAARALGLTVIYVRLLFRPGYPEVATTNDVFARLAAGPFEFTESGSDGALHAAFAPHAGELEVVKRRVSAFSGGDLEMLLRAANIDTLVLTGITTSGVVLSTVREAADRDFRLVVLSDACTDPDPEVHRVLLEKVFVRQAEVVTVHEWASR